MSKRRSPNSTAASPAPAQAALAGQAMPPAPVPVPERKVPVFKVSKMLKDRVALT